ncbi:hypothetical protein TRIUR3_35116 [Triticum urartu]|uniref:Uncharacterized protein n=1 Tax=Triticum urartu TaxID=4572 RepID=M7Z619_TRIUA|nr:hypothetical protein TRIUR3_35116 [Triticum urartu]
MAAEPPPCAAPPPRILVVIPCDASRPCCSPKSRAPPPPLPPRLTAKGAARSSPPPPAPLPRQRAPPGSGGSRLPLRLCRPAMFPGAQDLPCFAKFAAAEPLPRPLNPAPPSCSTCKPLGGVKYRESEDLGCNKSLDDKFHSERVQLQSVCIFVKSDNDYVQLPTPGDFGRAKFHFKMFNYIRCEFRQVTRRPEPLDPLSSTTAN